jgi:aminoglycoside 6'-N-acetyltransferase I
MREPVTTRLAVSADTAEVTRMFHALWPKESRAAHARDVRATLAGSPRTTLPLVVFVAEANARLVGFAEVGLRSHADGCDARRPVGYLEGWYVERGWRKRGIGRRLMAMAAKWCRAQGAREIASDTWATNRDSVTAHCALGFEVVDRVVNFRRAL